MHIKVKAKYLIEVMFNTLLRVYKEITTNAFTSLMFSGKQQLFPFYRKTKYRSMKYESILKIILNQYHILSEISM